MADTEDLGKQILGLFRESLQNVYEKFTLQDRQNLADYSRQLAKCTIDRRATADPAEQARLDLEIAGFKGAINLMVDRYLLTANHEADRSAYKALKISAEWLINILIASM